MLTRSSAIELEGWLPVKVVHAKWQLFITRAKRKNERGGNQSRILLKLRAQALFFSVVQIIAVRSRSAGRVGASLV